VKELENMLMQERHARKSAEEKAKALELLSAQEPKDTLAPIADSQLDNSPEKAEEATPEKPDAETLEGPTESEPEQALADSQPGKLQRRLETLMGEMEEMRKQVSLFKDRAEKAENETVETRKSLAEMIETLRKERAEAHESRSESVSGVQTTPGVERLSPQPDDESAAGVDKSKAPLQHSVLSPRDTGAESPAPGVTAQTHRRLDAIEQSSPYASMLGVVLLGVGLMAYLNGWQKMDK
jgi:hypothetical protein